MSFQLRNKTYLFLAFCLFVDIINAQDELESLLSDESSMLSQEHQATFKTSRIINTHSTEMVKQNHLDFRIAHRFGDIGGVSGGPQTLFGIDNASDINISFEYGLYEKITLGLARSKGGNTLKSIVSAFFKYKILAQTKDNNTPVSIVFLTHSGFSYMSSSDDLSKVTSFPKLAHRLSYVSQILIAKKFSKSFSLQLSPTCVHRNLVHYEDQNSLFGMGVGARLKLSKRFGLIADYVHLFREKKIVNGVNYFNPLALGIEIETGGHVFHLNFTNSRSINETQYLPHTSSNIFNGQYRFGFNISRVFAL